MIYAPAGTDEFQVQFGKHMEELAQDTAKVLGSNLCALVLGGGFGRGEGGITRASGEEKPFNDVDLFLFVQRAAEVDKEELHRLEHLYSDKVGAEVEFSVPFAKANLGRIRPAQMWFDLIHGHTVLTGETNIVEHFAPAVASAVPPHEGARLLLNRGAGLLWARLCASGVTALPDADFIRRNVWKSNLALRDAALILDSKYPSTWKERPGAYHKWRSSRNPAASLLQLEAIARAAKFKTEPDLFPAVMDLDLVVAEWTNAFLELESIRFGKPFDADAYGGFHAPRELAPSPADSLRTLIRNLRRGQFSALPVRQKLYELLPQLLVGGVTSEWKGRAENWLADWKRWC